MSDENPLAKLGDLTKPATVLIEKISEAVGGVFRPYQIVRIAKAEAEAGRIQAEAQIQVTDLHRRAMHRFLEEEAKKQSKMGSRTAISFDVESWTAAHGVGQLQEDTWTTSNSCSSACSP
jgi:hypothetical protein